MTMRSGRPTGRSTPKASTSRSGAGGSGGSGSLQVLLGAQDNSDMLGMSGGWDRTFTLTGAERITLTFRYKRTQSAHRERDEFCRVPASLNGTLVGLNGDGFADLIVREVR